MRAIPGNHRRRYQIDADAVNALAVRLKRSPSVGALVTRTRMPAYGILSLVQADLLRKERDPAILAIRPWTSVAQSSVEDLELLLAATAKSTAIPGDAVEIRSAIRRFGGGPKPWGLILGAIVDGSLRAWLKAGPALDTRSLLVVPDDLTRFDAVAADEWRLASLPDTISQDDLGELLNASPKYLPQVHADFGTRPFIQAKADCIRVEDALEIARRMVTTAELGWLLSCIRGKQERRCATVASKG